jgi:hypothetical protein
MRARIFALLLILYVTTSFGTVHADSPPPRVGRNIDITAANDLNNRQQVEPSIAVHPLKPDVLVAGAQDLRLVAQGGHRWHGYYRSTDGGRTWSVSLLPGFPGDTSPEGTSSPLQNFNLTTDPVLAFDRSGNLYYTGVAVKVDPTSNEILDLALFVAKYVNDGQDYSGATLIDAGPRPLNCCDKPWIAVDTSTGPHSGNVYVVSAGLAFTRSTDGGQTFSRPPHRPNNSFASGVTVDATGNVFVVLPYDSPEGILVARSSDGGVSFESPVVAAGFVPVFQLPGNSFRVLTLPQIAADESGVYVVWDDFGTGDSDVLFVRSADGGASWSSPLRLNDATTGHQLFPTIAAASGKVSVAWYDSRLGQLSNGTIAGLDVFYTVSLDGGASFVGENLRVTETSFDPNRVLRTDPVGQELDRPFIGDYIHIATSSTAAHPIWTDNRNACTNIDPTLGCLDQDVFTATINFESPIPPNQ